MKHLPPDLESCLALPGGQVLGAFQRVLRFALVSADMDGLRLYIAGAPERPSPLSDPDHLARVAGMLAKCLVATWPDGGEIVTHVDEARLRAPLAHRYGLIGAGHFTTVSARGISNVQEDQSETSRIARAFGHVRAGGGHFVSENEGASGTGFTIYLQVPPRIAVTQGIGTSARPLSPEAVQSPW